MKRNLFHLVSKKSITFSTGNFRCHQKPIEKHNKQFKEVFIFFPNKFTVFRLNYKSEKKIDDNLQLICLCLKRYKLSDFSLLKENFQFEIKNYLL